jgi:hypothetical protein
VGISARLRVFARKRIAPCRCQATLWHAHAECLVESEADNAGPGRTTVQCAATSHDLSSLEDMSRLPAPQMLIRGLLLAALGGAAKVGNAEADRAPATVCGSSDGHTVIAGDAEAEVYRLREHTLAAATYEYRGCIYGSRRSVRLGRELLLCDPSGCFMVNHVTLAGTTVAYETFFTSSFSPMESKWRVAVVNLRSGCVLHRVPTGITSPPSKEFCRRRPGDGYRSKARWRGGMDSRYGAEQKSIPSSCARPDRRKGTCGRFQHCARLAGTCERHAVLDARRKAEFSKVELRQDRESPRKVVCCACVDRPAGHGRRQPSGCSQWGAAICGSRGAISWSRETDQAEERTQSNNRPIDRNVGRFD